MAAYFSINIMFENYNDKAKKCKALRNHYFELKFDE